MDHAISHLAHAFLVKLKKIVCNSTICTLDDDGLPHFTQISSLFSAAHVNTLQFFIFEMNNALIEDRRRREACTPPFVVANIDCSGAPRFGHGTPILATMREASVMFGSASLNIEVPCTSCKKNIITTAREGALRMGKVRIRLPQKQ